MATSTPIANGKPTALATATLVLQIPRDDVWDDTEVRLFYLGGHPKPAINRHLKTGN